MYYFGARYYDPLTGRFTTRDTVYGSLSDPQSQNRYVYCRNNPQKFVDPDGHDYEDPWRLYQIDPSKASLLHNVGIHLVIGYQTSRMVAAGIEAWNDANNYVKRTGRTDQYWTCFDKSYDTSMDYSSVTTILGALTGPVDVVYLGPTKTFVKNQRFIEAGLDVEPMTVEDFAIETVQDLFAVDGSHLGATIANGAKNRIVAGAINTYDDLYRYYHIQYHQDPIQRINYQPTYPNREAARGIV